MKFLLIIFTIFICRYVVDLVRFRQIAAGDRLRGQYQALSQDPNSLSNLDQVCFVSTQHSILYKILFSLHCIVSNLFRIYPTT